MKQPVSSAFSLVELTLAIGVAAVCLVTVLGLLPVGVQTNRNAASQTAATNIIAAVVADMRATPRCQPTSNQYQIQLGTQVGCPAVFSATNKTLYFDGTGYSTTSSDTNSRYQLNVAFNVGNLTGICSAASPCATLTLTWPAQANPTSASGSVQVAAVLDRN